MERPRNQQLVHPNMLHIGDPMDKSPLFTEYFGQRGLAFTEGIQDGRFGNDPNLFALYRRGLDRHFYQVVSEKFGVPTLRGAQDFFIRQLKHSNEAMEILVQKALPEGFDDVYGLDNAVAIPSDSPAKRVYKMITHPQGDIQNFEFIRQFCLAEVLAHLHVDYQDDRMLSKLSDVQDIFDTQLYSADPQGNLMAIRTTYAYHDDETNEYITQVPENMLQMDGIHIKQHNFKARYVDGIGYVLTQPRKKRDPVAGLKAYAKAIKKETAIDPRRDVRDSIGVMLTVLGDDEREGTEDSRDELTQRVRQLLWDSRSDELPIIDIEDDNLMDGQTKSNGMNRNRLQVLLEGANRPIEIVVDHEKAHVDGRNKVGDLDDPHETNRAHELFEISRAQGLFQIFFPPHIYNGHNYSRFEVPRLMEEKLHTKAEELRKVRRTYIDERMVAV